MKEQKLSVLDLILGSGLLGAIVAFLVREGQHKEKHTNLAVQIADLREDVDKVEGNVQSNADKIADVHVVQATILTKLDYITLGVDDIRQQQKEKK